jgi:hypothetical protein
MRLLERYATSALREGAMTNFIKHPLRWIKGLIAEKEYADAVLFSLVGPWAAPVAYGLSRIHSAYRRWRVRRELIEPGYITEKDLADIDILRANPWKPQEDLEAWQARFHDSVVEGWRLAEKAGIVKPGSGPYDDGSQPLGEMASGESTDAGNATGVKSGGTSEIGQNPEFSAEWYEQTSAAFRKKLDAIDYERDSWEGDRKVKKALTEACLRICQETLASNIELTNNRGHIDRQNITPELLLGSVQYNEKASPLVTLAWERINKIRGIGVTDRYTLLMDAEVPAAEAVTGKKVTSTRYPFGPN